MNIQELSLYEYINNRNKISKRRKETKSECFKLVTDLAASSGKVLMGTISLLK